MTMETERGYDKRISVIIPVYNSEKYLEECLDSVVNQTYQNLEIILINDGSTDSSPEICKRYATMDGRIVFLNQENGGEAAARNVGLRAATGELLMFVDSDDMLTLDICEQAAERMQDYDVMLLDYQVFQDAKELGSRLSQPSGNRVDLCGYTKEDWIHSQLGHEKRVPKELNLNTVWGKVYKRNFIDAHRIEVPLGVVIGPDMLFNLRVFLQSPRVCYLPAKACFYRYNHASIVHRYIANYQQRDERFQKALADILQHAGVEKLFTDEAEYQKVNGLLQVFSSDIFHHKNPKASREKKAEFLRLVNRSEYTHLISKHRHKFEFAKSCALFFAIRKWYMPIKFLYIVKTIQNRLLAK